MRTLLITGMALLLASCSTSSATNIAVDESVKAKTPENKILEVSREGFAAMRAVRAARIAIFDGQPKLASKMLDKAMDQLNSAAKNAPEYVVDVKTTVDGKKVEDDIATVKKHWIPIDGQIMLADTFVPSLQNVEHIKKANKHFKNGRSKEALEELRLGDIEVSFSRVLMPLNATTGKVAEAVHLMDEHQYYEANLVLKAAEDDLIVDLVSLIALPKTQTDTQSK
ncbi:MAG: YfdX family protein [Pirellulales bacterium]|nr:YfdX family protein [Pirellulales bacterium]